MRGALMTKIRVYKYTAIYIREHSKADWVPIETKIAAIKEIMNQVSRHTGDWLRGLSKEEKQAVSELMEKLKKEEISPYHQVKAVVIFNKGEQGINGFVPVSLQVYRVDGIDAPGPKYKTISRALGKGDLQGLPGLQALEEDLVREGHYACVFEPFYQFGKQTIFGVKPMVSSNIFSSFGRAIWYKDIKDYYGSGNLSNMRYSFELNIGKGEKTKIGLPVSFTQYDDVYAQAMKRLDARLAPAKNDTQRQTRKKFEPQFFMQELQDLEHMFEMSLDHTRQGEENMVLKEFLLSNTAENKFDPLFEDNIQVVPMIRINGEGNPWIMAHKAFDREIAQYKAPKIRRDKTTLIFDKFSWDSSVEFLFVLSCEKLNVNPYVEKNVSYFRIPGSVVLFEDATFFEMHSNCNGPKLGDLKFEYIGKTGCSPDNKNLPKEALASEFPFQWNFEYGIRPEEDKEALIRRSNKPQDEPHYAELRRLLKKNLNAYKPTLLSGLDLQKFCAMTNGVIGTGRRGRALNAKSQSVTSPDNIRYTVQKDRRYYMAYKKMEYKTPLGRKVYSIRPFGNAKINEDGSKKDDYYRYEFKDFMTLAGGATDELEKGFLNYAFYFSAPDDFLRDQPWTEKPDKATQKVMAECTKPAGSEDADKKDTCKMDPDKAIEWLEDKAADTQLEPVSAINNTLSEPAP
ncbi:hypothetical protein MNBD_GAMMA10-456 [hydrothermal vent metagenome]|uniref:Uncharacterized protein n=1 Tax=hydrothermal vent metagenome TaxID=652676 RepID=A0A3B0XEM4_9ZZZZ